MDRINEILDFFKKEGIVVGCLDVTFDENEDTQFGVWEISININAKEINDLNFIEAEALTCGEDVYLLEEFTNLEIGFFHELGHYCDLAYRFDFNPKAMSEESEKFEEYHEAMYVCWKAFEDDINFHETYKHAIKFYRSFGVEKVADENARDLMKYYLENCK